MACSKLWHVCSWKMVQDVGMVQYCGGVPTLFVIPFLHAFALVRKLLALATVDYFDGREKVQCTSHKNVFWMKHVIASYDLVLCDICGDEVYWKFFFFGEPRCSPCKLGGAEQLLVSAANFSSTGVFE